MKIWPAVRESQYLVGLADGRQTHRGDAAATLMAIRCSLKLTGRVILRGAESAEMVFVSLAKMHSAGFLGGEAISLITESGMSSAGYFRTQSFQFRDGWFSARA